MHTNIDARELHRVNTTKVEGLQSLIADDY